jgi:hypothetical protein
LESELQNENIRNLNNSKKTNQNFKNSIWTCRRRIQSFILMHTQWQ